MKISLSSKEKTTLKTLLREQIKILSYRAENAGELARDEADGGEHAIGIGARAHAMRQQGKRVSILQSIFEKLGGKA